jgi:hypothetical protein
MFDDAPGALRATYEKRIGSGMIVAPAAYNLFARAVHCE